MGAETDKSVLERIVEVLLAHGVEFIVVRGQAEVLLGSPRVTYDVDLCYRPFVTGRAAPQLRTR